jgi:hypothetical protein
MSTVTIIRSLLKNDRENRCTDEGNFPMTMQVGLVGSNGIVIAGDERNTHIPLLRPNQFWAAGTHGTNSSKMIVNYKRGIAVSAARDLETAMHVANEIATHLPEDKFQDPASWIEECADKILGIVRREHSDPTERIEAQCLIMTQRPVPKLFQFWFGVVEGKWGPFCREMSRLAVAGDNVNAAIFWPEAYYNSSPYSKQRIPVKDLIPLAAHTVVQANRFNPLSISGLEVVFCDETGLHKLSRESIETLLKVAEEWDKQFGKTIFDHSQDFTFDPES